MAISEQERRRRAAIAARERVRREAEKTRMDEKRRGDELESQRLQNDAREQERLDREQRSKEEDDKRRREKEDFDNSAAGQAYQTAKTVAPPLAGLYVGHRQASGIEGRQSGMPPARQASMGTARRFAPYAARSMLFLPEGYLLREHVAPQIQSETGRDLARAGGTGMMLAGSGLLGEGMVRALTPQERGGPRVPATAPDTPPAPPAPAQPPAAAPAAASAQPQGPRPHADRLIAAARAAGAKGPLTKTTAASYLEGNLSAGNRAAVAQELGIKPGRNYTSRISETVRNMAKTRGASSVLLPFAAGALAYDAASSDAEAAGEGTGDQVQRGALAGATAAGTAYGAGKALSMLPDAVKSAAGTASVGFLPSAVDAMTDYTPDEMAQGRNLLARYLPDALRGGAVEEAHQMAQVPERNPRQAAMAVRNEDAFEQELAAFMAAIEEHNAGVESYGP